MTSASEQIQPGVYYKMSALEYHAAPGLSNSGMKDLLISPLTYWSRARNPEAICCATSYRNGKKEVCGERRVDHPTSQCKYFHREAETPSLRIGSAMHAAVLEPDTFLDRYNNMVTEVDFPGCLKTTEDIKAYLDSNCVVYKKSSAKPELITYAKRFDPQVKILDEVMGRHAAANKDKILLNKQEWDKVYGMARALRREDALRPILARGKREVSIFVIDPDTGVLLKCRVDWMQDGPQCAACGAFNGRGGSCQECFGGEPGKMLDLKSFAERGEAIDRTVIKTIRYEGYDRQAWLYKYICRLAGLGEFTWSNAFVASEEPYEVRLRSMGPDLTPRARYWEEAAGEAKGLIRLYAQYDKEFGDNPWAYHQEIKPVRDSEVPALGFRDREEE